MELETSKQAGKTAPRKYCGFFAPEIRELWSGGLGNIIPEREIPKAAPVAGFNLLTTLNRAFRNLKLATGATMKKRNLKVRNSYYEYQLNKFPRPPSVPVIELKGYWLNQIGFEIGKQLQVLPGTDHLVITLAPDESS